MYSELVKYKKLYGNCNVSRGYLQNPTLFKWVNTQRATKKKGKLDLEKISLLDKIGFTWSFQKSWRERYNELLSFKDSQGAVNFIKAKGNKSLRNWISLQRHQHKKGILPQEFKELLDNISFPWE
jgi:hypothetical protein